MRSEAKNVDEYLGELPDERRDVVAQVRQLILANLPAGYRETMNWGMISYEIPLERYPITYNKQPLGYLALAAQKNDYSLYLFGAYADAGQMALLEEGFIQAGKKLDMGKSCLHFRKLDDLPLDVIARVVAAVPPDEMIALYEKSRVKT